MKNVKRARPDFILVQLTPAGITFAGTGATLRVATAHMDYTFEGDTPVEVQRAGEWPALRRRTVAGGEPMFQPYQDAALAAPTKEISQPVEVTSEAAKDEVK